MKKKEGKYEENKLSNISYEKKMCFFAKKKKEEKKKGVGRWLPGFSI